MAKQYDNRASSLWGDILTPQMQYICIEYTSSETDKAGLKKMQAKIEEFKSFESTKPEKLLWFNIWFVPVEDDGQLKGGRFYGLYRADTASLAELEDEYKLEDFECKVTYTQVREYNEVRSSFISVDAYIAKLKTHSNNLLM